MSHKPDPGFHRLRFLTLLYLAAAVCGCGDEKSACRPEVAAGRIAGTVRTGMPVPKLAITATRIPVGGQNTVVEDGVPDASGRYQIDVPAGLYTISLRINGRHYYSFTRAGFVYSRTGGDTIRVDETRSPVSVDFDLATLRVTMAVPSELNGVYGKVTLVRRGDRSSPGYESGANREDAQVQDGSLTIVVPCVIPGAYKVAMDLDYVNYACGCVSYDGEHFWLPATRDSSQVPWTEVVANGVTDIGASLDPNPARVEGDVVGAWQTLDRYSPPYLSLLTPDSTVVIGPRTVADDGSFGIDVFLPCPVKIKVSEDGFDRWIGGRSFEEAQVFDLEHGQTVRGLQVVQSGLRVDLGPDSVQFHTGFFDARLYDAQTRRLVGVYQPPMRVSDERAFPIANLAQGSYVLRIAQGHPGEADFLSQWYDRASSIDEARPITIAADGETIPVEVTLVRGGSISGAILNNHAVSCLVYFTSSNDLTTGGFWFGGETYKVWGLEDGDYKVGVWPNDHQYPDRPPPGTVWYPGTTDWSGAGVVSIRDHAAVSGIDITLP